MPSVPDGTASDLDGAFTADSAASLDGSVHGDAATGDSCGSLGCPQTINWISGPSMPIGIDHHGVTAAETSMGHFIYLTGGFNADQSLRARAVTRYQVQPNGTLSAPVDQTQLPATRAGHAALSTAGRLYVIGGQLRLSSTSVATATVLSAQIQPDGTLGVWRNETSFAAPRLHLAAVVSGTRIYVLGGTPGVPDALASVQSAEVGADGVLGAFRAEADLPAARTHLTAYAGNGSIVVVGGLGLNGGAQNDLLRAPLQAGGVIASWQLAGTLPAAPNTHATIATPTKLYVLGGLLTSSFSEQTIDTIRVADISLSGDIGPFQNFASTLPKALAHVHSMPVVNGKIYIMGGRNSSGLSETATWIGPLPQ